ncbi:DMT family transporter [Oscillospiraceae bacterium PP1C4]
MNSKPISRNRALFYVFIAALLWASGGVFVKLLDAHPLTISGWRALIALPVLLFAYKPRTLRFPAKVWLFAAFPTITGILYVCANKLTTAANAIVLQFVSPVFIILFGAIFFHERIYKEDLFVTAACIGGMALFFFDELSAGGLLGNLLAVLSGVTSAAFFMCMNRTKEDTGSIILASQFETIAIGLPFMFLSPVAFTPVSLFALCALGLLQRGASSIIYARGARHCGALDAVLVSIAEPLLNPVFVMLLFNERPGRLALVGAIVIVVSVLLWNISKQRFLHIENANS